MAKAAFTVAGGLKIKEATELTLNEYRNPPPGRGRWFGKGGRRLVAFQLKAGLLTGGTASAWQLGWNASSGEYDSAGSGLSSGSITVSSNIESTEDQIIAGTGDRGFAERIPGDGAPVLQVVHLRQRSTVTSGTTDGFGTRPFNPNITGAIDLTLQPAGFVSTDLGSHANIFSITMTSGVVFLGVSQIDISPADSVGFRDQDFFNVKIASGIIDGTVLSSDASAALTDGIGLVPRDCNDPGSFSADNQTDGFQMHADDGGFALVINGLLAQCVGLDTVTVVTQVRDNAGTIEVKTRDIEVQFADTETGWV